MELLVLGHFALCYWQGPNCKEIRSHFKEPIRPAGLVHPKRPTFENPKETYASYCSAVKAGDVDAIKACSAKLTSAEARITQIRPQIDEATTLSSLQEAYAQHSAATNALLKVLRQNFGENGRNLLLKNWNVRHSDLPPYRVLAEIWMAPLEIKGNRAYLYLPPGKERILSFVKKGAKWKLLFLDFTEKELDDLGLVPYGVTWAWVQAETKEMNTLSKAIRNGKYKTPGDLRTALEVFPFPGK